MEQTYSIACRGGLDLTTNTQELLRKPGWATRLLNFEPSNDGGYRRVSGYTTFGSGRTPGTEQTPIKGIKIITDNSIIVCHEDKVWFTYNGTDYVQINKELTPPHNAVNYTDLQALPSLGRGDSIRYDFKVFRIGTSIIVMGVSEGHLPFYFSVTGTTIEDSMYVYKEIDVSSGSLSGAYQCEKFKDQLVISGMDSAPSEIYYSDILAPDDFEGSNAGSIGFNDTVVGLQMFRENLYVFCKNSIHRVSGLSTGVPERVPVTMKIGCVNGDSIQEIAGDVVFLAPDGLRTLSATDKIGDVNLGSLSENIVNKLRTINRNIGKYSIRTTVLKNKVQYRCFIKGNIGESVGSYSFIMKLGTLDTGERTTEFSELSGFDVAAIDNGYLNGGERTLSGDSQGNIWYHDEGIDFNGSQPMFLYETPYFAIEDPAIRKNLHKLITYIKLEGVTNFTITVKYDYGSTSVYQPAPYVIDELLAPAVYGESIYTNNQVRYGTTSSPVIKTLTEGSGKNMAIRISPATGPCAPFSLQGFDLYYIPGGRI